MPGSPSTREPSSIAASPLVNSVYRETTTPPQELISYCFSEGCVPLWSNQVVESPVEHVEFILISPSTWVFWTFHQFSSKFQELLLIYLRLLWASFIGPPSSVLIWQKKPSKMAPKHPCLLVLLILYNPFHLNVGRNSDLFLPNRLCLRWWHIISVIMLVNVVIHPVRILSLPCWLR